MRRNLVGKIDLILMVKFSRPSIMKSSLPFICAGIALLLLFSSCTKPKEPVYLDFQNLHVQKAGLSESVVRADVRCFNPNSFNLRLKKAELDVFVNDKYVGHSTLDTLIHIPALDTFYVPITLKLNLSNFLKNAVQLFLNPEVKLKVQGKAKVGKSGFYKNFPVSYEGKQRIDVLLRDTAIINQLR
jgi:LEA14-like dessication related protein